MNINDYSDLGRERITEIFEQGWSDIEFIEIVFREWVKLNQIKINNEYFNQKGINRLEGDIDQFSLWLVDNIYLQLYCKGNDSAIVKEFCVKHFGYKEIYNKNLGLFFLPIVISRPLGDGYFR